MDCKHLLLIPIMPIIIQINESPMLQYFKTCPPKDISRTECTPCTASVDEDFYFRQGNVRTWL